LDVGSAIKNNEIYILFGAGFWLYIQNLKVTFSLIPLTLASKNNFSNRNQLEFISNILKIGAILYGSGYVLLPF
jgi:hypothetical protein